ncbi:branched-chain amino acid ABC transporter substrate-binding protein [Methylovirgula sp. 4M-Z18]|uniref:branched-chain amino acid ABC transporter substrate-binding protein n=1 Tax=Methylovirgula sp. 4M-Z18 TaxID=2293567 RepID=UPI000E2E760B|nr:branched-chain amino acid ABC transporter substrate-binding protein [Methylovirgula sp. 4M-Z18]RFB78060.1 branched-chain amino acid ABC transporter substrate-binding protein [Methylovirgula sp. 4M-Z18]
MKTLHLSSLMLCVGLAWAGAAQAQVKLGVVGPMTGPNAVFGKEILDGTKLAVDDINAAGGVLGQKIEIDEGDDVSDPKQGVSVANKLAADGVKLVVGHYNSGVNIPASEVYEDNDMLDISPGATNPKLTDRGMWNVFRTCGRDDQQGAVAGAYLAKELKGKKVAFIHDKTTYGKGLADETRKVALAKGVPEVLYEGVNAGEKDYSAIVSKIRESGADVVYWGGLQTEGGLIARQMHDQGMKVQIMSGDGIVTNEYATIGGDAVIGTLMTFGPDPAKKASAAKLVAEMKAKNVDPGAFVFYSYAAVEIMKQAADTAKSLDSHQMADAIHSGMIFHTVLGDLSFDAKGDRKDPDYVMYSWNKDAAGQITYTELAK